MRTAAIEAIQHWELSGGRARIVYLSATRSLVELCACTGESMESISSTDPGLSDYLATRLGVDVSQADNAQCAGCLLPVSDLGGGLRLLR